MKKIIGLIAIAIFSNNTYSQATRYAELGALISADSYNGSARFSAMSGAFGAIGGDLSSVTINPAGAAVGLHNQLSFSLANTTTNTESFFLDNKIEKSENYDFDLSNASGSIVFNCSEESKWKRVSLFFNYQIKTNYESNFDIASDKQKQPFFTDNLNDLSDNRFYNNLLDMTFERSRFGKSSVVNLGIAALTNDNFHLGSSINFHTFDFIETNTLTENNEDAGNKKISALNVQERDLAGNGVSLSIGAIYKIKQFRAGLSFETPTFYSEIIETSNIYYQNEDLDFDGYTKISDDIWNFETNDEFEEAVYAFRSPLKLTASMAWVFGKKGLINIDYSYRNFSSMNFNEEGDFFKEENKYTTKTYTNASSLNIGTEWRINKLKLRAGYEYKQDPNTATKDNTSINGISTGIGYSYKNMLFDLSYTRRNHNNNYDLYNNNDILNKNNSNRITGTITFLM